MAAESSQSVINMGSSQIEQYEKIASGLEQIANKLSDDSSSYTYPISVPPP